MTILRPASLERLRSTRLHCRAQVRPIARFDELHAVSGCVSLNDRVTAGEPLDVLVVGIPNHYDLTAVCLDLSGRYGIEVSPMIVSSDEFRTRGQNPILDEIATGPIVEVRQ